MMKYRRRRSEMLNFEFKKHCIFCGEYCVAFDNKNPSRYRLVSQCRSAEISGERSFEDLILDRCDERSDVQSEEVRIRLVGAQTDLHAADAQYHRDCNMSFMSARNVISAHSKAAHSASTSPDDSFQSLIDVMNGDPAHVWTSVELQEHYTNISDDSKITTRKQLVGKPQSHFGETLVKFDISGCASLFCFKDHLPKMLRLVRIDDDGHNIIDNLKDTIISECKALPKSNDYDISQFRQSCTLTNTSPSLLTFIAKMVSDGKITRTSTTLAQCIQTHVTQSYNQTSLGLAVKLHHKFGSKELLTILHEYGITVTYDEVLRFRTSAAIFTGKQPYTFRGLKRDDGILSSWVDNYDLNVFTPNGCRESHALVVEVTQQPQEDEVEDEQDTIQVIPRVSKADMNKTKLSELSPLTMYHYQGPKNPTPPVTHDHDGIPYKEAVKRMEAIDMALAAHKDYTW